MRIIFIFAILIIPFYYFAEEECSGCVEDAPFEVNNCDNNGNPLEICFNVGGAYDLPDDTDVYWDFGDGTTSTAVNPCHTYAAAGSYTVTRRMEVDCDWWDALCLLHVGGGSRTCIYSDEVVVYDSHFSSNIEFEIICPDNIGVATFLPSSTDGVSWIWDAEPEEMSFQPDLALPPVDKPITNSDVNLTQNFTEPGEHNIYYSYGAGCYGFYTFNFDLLNVDSIKVTSDYNGENISCFEASDGQVTSHATGGTAPLTYSWDNGFLETNSNGISINDNISAGTYIVTITDMEGCITTDTIIVTQPDQLVGTNSVSPTICSSSSPVVGDIEITSINGGVPNYTILWNTGDTQLDLTAIQNGTYSYVVTDLNGCHFFDTLDLHNTSKPIADFSVNNECLYDPASFIDNSTTNIGTIANWEWNFDDGNSSANQNPSHYYQSSGNYTPTLIVTNSDLCKDTVDVPLIIHPVPQALFSAENECVYDSLCFANLSSLLLPDIITSYIYNFGDASSYSSLSDPCHLYNIPGDYNVTLIVSSNNGCIDDTTISITVYPKPNTDFSATTVCLNQPPTIFTNNSTILTSDNYLQWEWDFGDGYGSSLVNPNHTYSTAGEYTVELIGISNNNCSDTSETIVTVYEVPSTSFTSNIQDSCSIVCIDFESTSSTTVSSIENWEWNFNNGESSTEENPTSCFENQSNTEDVSYDITLITTNNLGCSDSLTNEEYITVWHNPIANYEPSSYLGNMYTNLFEFSNLSIGADSYYWDFNDGNYTTMDNPNHSYSDTGNYNVTLISSTIQGCSDTILKSLRVDAVTSIYAPNTFTPNGDQQNDIFKIEGYNIEEIELLIFDRWGLLLYSGIGLNPQWDGKHKGKDVQQDTYIWKAEIKDGFGRRKSLTGHINLLR